MTISNQKQMTQA